jgi:pimeloyl-ACP methyl ester carboxylesterase
MTPPKAALGLIGACKEKRVLTLPATGHALMAENPEGMRRALAQFAAAIFR